VSAPLEPTRAIRTRVLALLGPLLALALVSLAMWTLHRELQSFRLEDVATRLRELPPGALARALALTVLAYLALTGYDALAFHYIGNPLRYPRIALASYLGFAFSHNVGGFLLGGGAVRYRILSAFGVPGVDVARVIGFNVLTFWLGFLTLGGLVLSSSPPRLPDSLHLSPLALRLVGVGMLGVLFGYLAWGARHSEPLRLFGAELPAPGPGRSLLQIGVSVLDWVLASSVLYALLPADSGISFASFIGVFLAAQGLALLSNVPGGLGVLDSAMVLLLSPWLTADRVLASLLAYRAIYYVLPLLGAVGLFGAFELLQQRSRLGRARAVVAQWAPAVVPRVFALTTALAGVILLASGASPPLHGRFAIIARFLPLPVIEVSHFLGSAIGAALLLLARAIQRRVDAAYYLLIALLLGGIATSLLKGLDWEEASILAAMALAFLPTRRFFDRRSALLAEPFSLDWLLASAAALLGTLVLVLVAFRNVEYAHDLWWQFEPSAHASRSLRGLVAAGAVIAGYALARLLRPSRPVRMSPAPKDLERARAVVASSPRSQAHLALLGDKALLFSDDGSAFVMYGVIAQTWVAMGDPVGGPDQRRELVWRFRELADAHGGRAVFYEVADRDLSIYAEAGLSLRKLGEEARVPLDSFSLEGPERRRLRHARSRLQREGCTFEVLPPQRVAGLLDELEEISDAWLEQKGAREKRFSLGFFQSEYLAQTPLAIARHDGHLIAFANIWPSGGKEELSIDLMRYGPEAPSGVMDYLFTELMLWGREQGYRWFSLGMAPLAGLEQHRLAPLWNRAGALLFRYGDQFYGFQGLHSFKEKFEPIWEARFLAYPRGLPAPLILAQIAALIAGGPAGLLPR
jgi:phosphatidylglycerol lysyltransferase